MANTLSIIIPTLNEAETIERTLRSAGALDLAKELVVVDGASTDETVTLAAPLADRVIQMPQDQRGRARQMNTGAAIANGDYLLFLHADTEISSQAAKELSSAMAKHVVWGRFNVQITGQSFMLGMVACTMNWRSRVTGIATGDQAIFVRRDVFESIGGFSDQPLMEDIELSKSLRKLAGPTCLQGPVITSGRRWDKNGAFKTIILMWQLRWHYWRGTSAEQLAKAYR